MVGEPLEQWNGADATRRLEETIKAAQAENAKQQGTMLNWTRVATAMVFVTLLLTLIQVLHPR
jgi:hypothetical protein